MVKFISKAFKEIFSVIIWIALILVVVAGFIFLDNSPLLALLVWVVGLLMIILSAGLIGTFININTNLQKIIDQGFIISKNKITLAKNGFSENGYENEFEEKFGHEIDPDIIFFVKEKTTLFQEPNVQSKIVMELSGNTKVIVVRRDNPNNIWWCNIQTIDGIDGWIKENILEKRK